MELEEQPYDAMRRKIRERREKLQHFDKAATGQAIKKTSKKKKKRKKS